MFYHKTGYPEENDLVQCTVTNVQYNSVFCNMDAYGKSGMIHISEVAPGRIRNIRDYVVEGKKIICRVLRINEERGHIDLSLRRVNENQRREMNALIKQEQKAEKIIENLAVELKKEPKALYDEITTALFTEYEYLHTAFQEHVDGDANLEESKLPKEILQPLLERVTEKIKPKSVTIGGTLQLETYAENGNALVKKALTEAANTDKERVKITYLGSAKYKVEVTADEYQDAEVILEDVVEKATSPIEESEGGSANFTRS